MKPSRRGRVGVFAYGSNIHEAQMKRRCPSAIKLAGAGATLANHRLTFTGWSESWRGAVATIEPVAKGSVHGVVWWITEEDLATLDRFEGHPVVYRRETLEVLDSAGHTLKVQVYVKSEDTYESPSMDYVCAIWKGYNENNLPTRFLRQAVERVSLEVGGA